MRKGYIELEDFASLSARNLKGRANFTEQPGLKLMPGARIKPEWRTLAPGAHLPDLLHLRMRLAAQRQVQVSKSGVPGCAGEGMLLRISLSAYAGLKHTISRSLSRDSRDPNA